VPRLLLLCLAACAASTQTAESTDFRPQLCSGGSPGDPTCPMNQVELSIGSGADMTIFGELAFTVATDGHTLTTSTIDVRAFTHGLHVAQLGFASAATTTVVACPASPPADAQTIDLQPNATTTLPPQMVADARYACVVYAALGAYR